MDVVYAIVKVYVTERNDVKKCHRNAITKMAGIKNRSDCIIKKIYVQKWKVCKKKGKSIMVVRGR